MRVPVALLGAWCACAVVLVAARQNPAATPPQAPSQPTFQAATHLIQVDVSVLDKQRQPIRGLAATDFTVMDDGKPQKVTAFTAMDVPEPVATTVPWLHDVAPDVTNNSLDERRIVMIVLDDALIPGDTAMIAEAKKIGHSVVDKLGPKDLASVVFTGDSRGAQDFTSDHARLNAAVDKLSGGLADYSFGYNAPGVKGAFDSDDHFFEGSIETLRNVTESLIDAPQRRKALVLISPGVPLDPASQSPTLASGTGKGQADMDVQVSLIAELPGIFKEAQRANIAVYSFSPGGNGALEQFMRTRLAIKKVPVDVAQELAHTRAKNDMEFLETTAENTGGQAIVNAADVEPAIAQMFRETGTYYLLGYESPNPNDNGKLHRVNVTVDRPGADVHVRSGYYAPPPPRSANAVAPAPLVQALSGVLPDSDMPMQVALAPFAMATKNKSGQATPGATVTIALGFRQLAPNERATDQIDLETSAYSPDGNARGSQTQTATVVLKPGRAATDEAGYEALSRIDLKPGRYQLRLAAHSSLRNKSGSVFADIEIPDFANAPLSLSGLVLTATPALPASPQDAFAAVIPVVPTSDRNFTTADVLTSFLRIYQGGKAPLGPVTVSARVQDDHGGTPWSVTETIDASHFGSARAADERRDVPLAKLAPGAYLLSIDATLGATKSTRDVRFRVQ